jgi:hypothetical protein
MLKRGPTSRSQVGAVSSPDRQSVVRRNFAGAEAFLDLQRTLGNAFVQRLVQHTLAVGQAGERYEQKADRVAGAPARKKDAGSSMQAISRQAELGFRRMCTECNDEMQRGSHSRNGVIARQPDPSPTPDPGWSDAPEKGLNQWVTTVDEKGNFVPGRAASKGVWRVPVQGLSHGLQKGDKGLASTHKFTRHEQIIRFGLSPRTPEGDE